MNCAFCCVLMLGLMAPAPGTGIFSEAARVLSGKTTIAVRLPVALPDLGQGAETVYAVVQKAEPDEYSVLLAFTPDCNGGTSCRIGELSGAASRPPEGPEKTTLVRLGKGLRGRWTEAECGANCSDSRIVWRQENVWYAVGVKAGSRKDVLELARAVARAKPL